VLAIHSWHSANQHRRSAHQHHYVEDRDVKREALPPTGDFARKPPRNAAAPFSERRQTSAIAG
jgi:hypothetical protein